MPYDDEDDHVTDQDDTPVEEAPEQDSSPLIQAFAVKHNGHSTDIVAQVHTPQGIQSKRIVLPGGLTANRLAKVLKSVATW